MATLPCEGTYDGYEDYDEDAEVLEYERQLDDLAETLIDQVSCGDISEAQGRMRYLRAAKRLQ